MRHARLSWRVVFLSLSLVMAMSTARAGTPNKVEVYRDGKGFKLQVDGKDFMVLGMNWGYVPVGENYN